MQGYRKEFPEFKVEDMPEIPEGFEDWSWHNDTCPSFCNESLGLMIWVDFARPVDREFPEAARFSLHVTDEAGCSLNDDRILLVTDDWNAILHKIADVKIELDRQAPPVEPPKSQVQRAVELLESAVGLLGGEPCDANEDSEKWFKEVEALIAEIRSQKVAA